MPYVLNRPMFRIGGPVSDKTGLATIPTEIPTIRKMPVTPMPQVNGLAGLTNLAGITPRRQFANGPDQDGITNDSSDSSDSPLLNKSVAQDLEDDPKFYMEDYYDNPNADFTGINEQMIHPDLYAAAGLNPDLSKQVIDHTNEGHENIPDTTITPSVPKTLYDEQLSKIKPGEKLTNDQLKLIMDRQNYLNNLSDEQPVTQANVVSKDNKPMVSSSTNDTSINQPAFGSFSNNQSIGQELSGENPLGVPLSSNVLNPSFKQTNTPLENLANESIGEQYGIKYPDNIVTNSDTNNLKNNLKNIKRDAITNPNASTAINQTNNFDPNAIYNLAGHDIKSSLSNIADFTKQKLTPTPSERLNNFLLALGGAGPANPLEPSTIGSRFQQAFGTFGKEVEAEQEKALSGESTAITRGISTLGRGASGAASNTRIPSDQLKVYNGALLKLNNDRGAKSLPPYPDWQTAQATDPNWFNYLNQAINTSEANSRAALQKSGAEITTQNIATKSTTSPEGLNLQGQEVVNYNSAMKNKPADLTLGTKQVMPRSVKPDVNNPNILIYGPAANAPYQVDKGYVNTTTGKWYIYKVDANGTGVFVPYSK